MGVVTVYLDKIRHLSDSDGIGRSDPYVQFYLEKNNMVFDKGYGKKVSTKKKGDCNPEYGETFTFEDVPSLDNMVLHVKVMDADIGLDDKIGSCKIDLEKLNPSAGGSTIENVIDGRLIRRDAKIFLKISYSEE
jgi:Ca2+-dependent lipid-binding protein